MKVSVCIPTYNQSLYIEQAIHSLVKQSYQPFEIIVSNDCSSDGTFAILQDLSQKIPYLKVINQPANLGLTSNTDTALRLASGDFIVRLDSDDYLAPDYIEKLGTLLEKYPEAGYAHAAVREIDENGNFKKRRFLSRKTGFYSSRKTLMDSINGYKVAANIIMFRRTALAKVNYLPCHVRFAEDYYLSVLLAAADFGNVYLNEILSFYRVWNDSEKLRQKRKIDEINGLRQVFEEALEPAFIKRNWNLNKLRNSRVNFACRQADCLSWSLYSSKEKEELLLELGRLSSAPKARLMAKFYLSGFGSAISIWTKLKYVSKAFIKGIIDR